MHARQISFTTLTFAISRDFAAAFAGLLTDPAITIAQDVELKTTLEARKATLTKHAEQARELQKGNSSIDPKQAPTTAPTKPAR